MKSKGKTSKEVISVIGYHYLPVRRSHRDTNRLWRQRFRTVHFRKIALDVRGLQDRGGDRGLRRVEFSRKGGMKGMPAWAQIVDRLFARLPDKL